MSKNIDKVVVPTKGIEPEPDSRRKVAVHFRSLVSGGARFLPVGKAKSDPGILLQGSYLPKLAVRLFNVTYYLTDFMHIEDLNFLIGYVAVHEASGDQISAIHPRIFYKDSSLLWRVASHIIDTPGEQWIGKGDLRIVKDKEGEYLASDESSTNLPFEIQTAFDLVSRQRKSRKDAAALGLVLRNAPEGRMEPYADFTAPRQRAAQRYNLNRGRPVASLTRPLDPTSLRFSSGFEPDFVQGLIEVGTSRSNLYGGELLKYRIASQNRQVQYQFVKSPTHVWINPPQSFMPEITSYGIRSLPVLADEDIFIPGYEYHFLDMSVDPPEIFSQIPEGWAGPASEVDPYRASAAPWIEALPVIKQFRENF